MFPLVTGLRGAEAVCKDGRASLHSSLYRAAMGHQRGMGTIRERRPGVWEIRVAVGTHPVTGRTTQRSVTFHGDECDARAYASELAAEAVARRTITMPAPMITVAAVLSRWLDADQPWKPSTYVGYRSNAGFLQRDAIGGVRVATLSPRLIRAAFARWEADGGTSSVIAGRFRVLRSAIGWAYDERIIDDHPIRTMRGPARPEHRRPIAHDDLTALLRTAEERLLEALANDTGAGRTRHRRHMAEQDLLLVRLAADSGARRGELVALQFSDFDDRVRAHLPCHVRRCAHDTEVRARSTPHPRRIHSPPGGAAPSRLAPTRRIGSGPLGVQWQYRPHQADDGQWARPPLCEARWSCRSTLRVASSAPTQRGVLPRRAGRDPPGAGPARTRRPLDDVTGVRLCDPATGPGRRRCHRRPPHVGRTRSGWHQDLAGSVVDQPPTTIQYRSIDISSHGGGEHGTGVDGDQVDVVAVSQLVGRGIRRVVGDNQ